MIVIFEIHESIYTSNLEKLMHPNIYHTLKFRETYAS